MLRVVSHALAMSQSRPPRRGVRVLQIHGCFAWARAQVACLTEPFRRKDLRRSQLHATWFRESRGAPLRILGDDTRFINSAFRFKKTQNLKTLPRFYFGGLGNEKLRRHDHRDKKSGRGVEQSNARLPANVRKMSEVPSN